MIIGSGRRVADLLATGEFQVCAELLNGWKVVIGLSVADPPKATKFNAVFPKTAVLAVFDRLCVRALEQHLSRWFRGLCIASKRNEKLVK